jgi:hypothetical protein
MRFTSNQKLENREICVMFLTFPAFFVRMFFSDESVFNRFKWINLRKSIIHKEIKIMSDDSNRATDGQTLKLIGITTVAFIVIGLIVYSM